MTMTSQEREAPKRVNPKTDIAIDTEAILADPRAEEAVIDANDSLREGEIGIHEFREEMRGLGKTATTEAQQRNAQDEQPERL